MSSIRCANVSHVRGPLRSPRPCPLAEVLTDSMGVDLHVTWEGLACSARHFRILPDTPVVTRVWLSQTADSFSHPHDAARTSVLALREDSPDRVASPHCRKAGNGYPKLVCLPSSVRQGHATHGVCLHRSYKHSPNPMMRIAPRNEPQNGGPGGVQKKGPNCPDWESY